MVKIKLFSRRASISAAAKALGIARATVSKYMLENKPYKGKYLFKTASPKINVDRIPHHTPNLTCAHPTARGGLSAPLPGPNR